MLDTATTLARPRSINGCHSVPHALWQFDQRSPNRTVATCDTRNMGDCKVFELRRLAEQQPGFIQWDGELIARFGTEFDPHELHKQTQMLVETWRS